MYSLQEKDMRLNHLFKLNTFQEYQQGGRESNLAKITFLFLVTTGKLIVTIYQDPHPDTIKNLLIFYCL